MRLPPTQWGAYAPNADQDTAGATPRGRSRRRQYGQGNEIAPSGQGDQMTVAPPAPTNWGATAPNWEPQKPPAGPDDGFMLRPGHGEQWWQQNQQKFSQPTGTQQYWQQVQGRMMGGANVPGFEAAGNQYGKQVFGDYYKGPGGTYSEQLFQKGPADFGSYYDRAADKALEKQNQALAARGVFAGSHASDQNRELLSDIFSQKALQEAGYMSGLAGQADDSAARQMAGMGGLAGQASGNELDYLRLGLQGAGASDAAGLAQSQMGMGGAFRAQDAMEGRERGNLADMMGWGGQLGQTYGKYTGDILSDYDQLQREMISGDLAIGGFNSMERARQQQGLWDALGMGAQVVGAGIGAGGRWSKP